MRSGTLDKSGIASASIPYMIVNGRMVVKDSEFQMGVLVGGKNFLPGTISAADRFVRAGYALKTSPKFKERRTAVAAMFSQMRAVGVPLGMSDPDKPNSTTQSDITLTP